MTPKNVANVKKLIRQLLIELGENPDRPGLKDTPRRVAHLWREFINYHPGTVDTAFESLSADQMVVVSGMRIWSFCEHHLVPFWADITIGYIPDKKVLGLSKFARIAHKHAHRLQLQERLARDIAVEVRELSGSRDVAVLAQGEHLCMVARGIKTPGLMTTSVVHGAFKNESTTREEFLRIVGMSKR